MTTMTYAPPQTTGFGSHGYGPDFGPSMQAQQPASYPWMAPQFAGGVPGGGALFGGVTPLQAAGQFYGITQPYGTPQPGGIWQQFGPGTPFGTPATGWLPQYPQQPQSPWQALVAVASYLQQILQAGPYVQGQQVIPYGQGQQQFARPWPSTY
jgi:hypothetical protein